MTQYARIVDNKVIELFNEPEGFTIDQCFHADIAAQFVEVPLYAGVAPGWGYAQNKFWLPGTGPAE